MQQHCLFLYNYSIIIWMVFTQQVGKSFFFYFVKEGKWLMNDYKLEIHTNICQIVVNLKIPKFRGKGGKWKGLETFPNFSVMQKFNLVQY